MKLFEAEAPFPNKIAHSFFYLLLIAIAVFYGSTIGNWSLSNDELSLIYRAHFNSFSEVVNLGVRTEAHPPLSHFIMWLWLKITPNNSAFFIRLPFVILGVFSLILFGITTKKQNGTVPAILVLALLASSQYLLIYITIARPYAVGLFFIAAAWFAIHLKNQHISFTLFVLAGFGAIYSHYFSLLALVFLWGYSLVYSKFGWTQKLLSAAIWLIGFIPYLAVFFDQINQEKLNWLAPPSSNFFKNFLLNFTNDSLIGSILLLTLLLIGLLNKPTKKTLLLFVPFVASLFIAFTYSIVKGPILQFSTLFFTFPLALIAIFSNLNKQHNLIKIAVQGLATVLCIWQFYTLQLPNKKAYFGVFQELVTTQNTWLQNPDYKKSACFASLNNFYYYEFYDFMGSNRLQSIDLESNEMLNEFSNQLDTLKSSSLIYSFSSKSIHPKLFVIIGRHFPYLISKKELFNSGAYLFSKIKPAGDYEYVGPPRTKENVISTCKDEYCWVNNLDLSNKFGLLVVEARHINVEDNAVLVTEFETINQEKSWYGTDFANSKINNPTVFEAHFIDSNYKNVTYYIWNRTNNSITLQEPIVYILPIKPPLDR